MRVPSRVARRFGVPATAALSLVLAGAAPALAGDTAPPDTTPPVISSTGLTDGQVVPRQPVLHPIVTDDVALSRVGVLAGKTAFLCTIDASQSISCPVTFPTALNGTDVDLTVSAFDAAGNRSDLTTRVHVVAVALSGTLTPKAGTAMRGGPTTATLSDVSAETTAIEMTDGPNGAVLATSTAAPWTFTWDATETAAPPCFRLSDPVGNTTTYCSNYIVSDEPPVITSVAALGNYYTDRGWSSQLDDGNGWTGADGTIVPFITDKAGIDHTELWVNGVLQGSSTARAPMFAWHDTTRGKTSANLEVRVSDRVGLTTTKSFHLNIDNAGPVLKVSPSNGTLVRGSQLTVTETAADQHRIFLPALGLPGMGFITSPVSWQYVMALHKDGPASTSFVGYDEYGNRTELTSTVIVDNTPPSVAFASAPANNAHLRSTVRLTAATSDKNSIAKVQLLVNGHVIATSTNPHYGFALVPSKYGKKFSVAFRAYDKAGNHRDTSKRNYNHG
jgi:hypothetical protein